MISAYRPERGVYGGSGRTWRLATVDTLIEINGQQLRAAVYEFSMAPAPDVWSVWDVRYFNVPGIGNVREEI